MAATIAACRPGGEPPRNVVLISIDTLNRSALRAYDPRAQALPNLDRFAAGARVFTNALSTAPWTLPAQASLFTGLYPDRHGATQPKAKIVAGAASLVEQMRLAAMETVAFTDAGFLDPLFGFTNGFDRYDAWTRNGNPRPGLVLPRHGEPDGLHGRGLFDRAVAFLEQRKPQDPPFFLFLHTYGVHDYNNNHPWAVARVGAERVKPSLDYFHCLVGKSRCSPADWEVLKALYDAEVLNADDGFGRLIKALDERGLMHSTQIVLTSDHGEGFDFERQRQHHGGRLHADLLRVPLLWSGPGVEPGAERQAVSLIDILPTVLDVLGVRVPESLDGRSAARLLRGGSAPAATVFFAEEYFMRWENGRRIELAGPGPGPLSIAVMTRDYWYIASKNGEEMYGPGDPEQRRRLAPLPALRRLAARRVQNHPAADSHALAPGLEEKLRSLGYLGGPKPP